MFDRSPDSLSPAELQFENVALDHLPDLQRAAVAFIDLQLAHLDAQRGRLLKAREVLVGTAVDVGATTETPRRCRPVAVPVPAASTNGHHERNGDYRPDAPPAPTVAEPDGRSLADRIEAYIREHGPTSCYDLAAGLGRKPSAVYNAIYFETTGRFVRTGRGRGTRWDVRRDDRAA